MFSFNRNGDSRDRTSSSSSSTSSSSSSSSSSSNTTTSSDGSNRVTRYTFRRKPDRDANRRRKHSPIDDNKHKRRRRHQLSDDNRISPASIQVQNVHSITANFKIKLQHSSGSVHYTEPFPENGDDQFRVKFQQEFKSWFIYITHWKPMNLESESKNKYCVKVKSQSPSITNSKPYALHISQQYNEWIMIQQFKLDEKRLINIKFDIDNVGSFEPPSTPNRATPLLWLLRNGGDHSTVELKGKNSSNIEVLQCALECRSEVFRRMFDVEMREKKEKAVSLEGMDEKALREFKEYLYACVTPKIFVKEIFLVANMYEMEDLKLRCAQELYAQVTIDNAMEVLQLATLYSFKPLVNALLLYCDEYRLEIIKK